MRMLAILGLMIVGGCLSVGCAGNTRVLSFTAPKPDDQPVFEWKGLGVEMTLRAVGMEFGYTDGEGDTETDTDR